MVNLCVQLIYKLNPIDSSVTRGIFIKQADVNTSILISLLWTFKRHLSTPTTSLRTFTLACFELSMVDRKAASRGLFTEPSESHFFLGCPAGICLPLEFSSFYISINYLFSPSRIPSLLLFSFVHMAYGTQLPMPLWVSFWCLRMCIHIINFGHFLLLICLY